MNDEKPKRRKVGGLEYKPSGVVAGNYVVCAYCDDAPLLLNQFGVCAECWATEMDESERAAQYGMEVVTVRETVREVVEPRVEYRPIPGVWHVVILIAVFSTVAGAGAAAAVLWLWR